MQDKQHEIEKKFYWNNTLAKNLLSKKTVRTKTFTDTYYDTATHQHTTSDQWLRNRGGIWQLKIPSSLNADAQVYQEIDDLQEIAAHLQLPAINKQTLEEAGIHPFITLHNTRHTYTHKELTICLDTVQNNSTYLRIGEIEKIVHTPSQSKQAEEEIRSYAQQQNIRLLAHEPKKVGVFLKEQHPTHYQRLIQTRVFNQNAYQTNPLTKADNY